MKVLLTGPNIYDKNRLGGIITVANTILALFPEMEYFARSGEKGKGILGALWEFKSIISRFRQRVGKGDLDIIHINSAFERSALVRDILFVRIARSHNIPVVLHIHGGKYFSFSPDPATRKMISYILQSAQQIIVLGKKEKEIIQQNYGQENVHILQNALDFSAIPEVLPKLTSPTIRFVYLGRIDEYKGLEDILDALVELKNSGFAFSYTLYGNGPLTSSYTESCRNRLGDYFISGGVVLGENKWQALNTCDVFLLPSLYEGLPMSLLEAMAVGALCITTPVGSIPEVIQDGENGLLVEINSPDQLQAKMEEICKVPNSFIPMAQKGQDTVEKTFNGEVFKTELTRIYQAV